MYGDTEKKIHAWMDLNYRRLIAQGLAPDEAYTRTIQAVLAHWILAQKDPVDGIKQAEEILDKFNRDMA